MEDLPTRHRSLAGSLCSVALLPLVDKLARVDDDGMIPPQMVKEVAYGRASELRELAVSPRKRRQSRSRFESILRHLTTSHSTRTRERTVGRRSPIGMIDRRQPSCNV